MKNIPLAITFAALTLFALEPAFAAEQEQIVQSGNLLPITQEQVARYGALKVYQGIWKAIDKSSTSDFLKTEEWKNLYEKPPLELKNDQDVKKAISILYSKTGDSHGSAYSQHVEDFTGKQKFGICTNARQGKIGYIRLSAIPRQFSTSEMKLALLSMPDINSLILDLRDNGGGYLTESLDVATVFCKEPVLLKLKALDGTTNTHKQEGTALFLKPMAVLINGDTASGGEILANILKEQRQAKLFGTKSAGSASIRALTNTDFGYVVAVKIAEVVRKDDSAIEKTGLKPDFEIDNLPWWKTSKDIKPSDSKIFADKTVLAAAKELKNEIK